MRNEYIKIKVYDNRDGETETKIEINTEQFYTLLGVDGPEGFAERFAPDIQKKLKLKCEELGKTVARYEQRVLSLECLMSNTESTLSRMRIAKQDMEAYIENMYEAIEKYKMTRREPAECAHSLSPESWQCSMCGTVSGKLSLFGKDGTLWRKIPRFCPGCGARNTDVEYDSQQDTRKRL